MSNLLYYGDNLDILRAHVRDESIDLIYLDPPFNSNAAYNVLFRSPAGQRSESQLEAFQDTWEWGESAARAYEEVIRSRYTDAATLLQAMRRSLSESDLMAYLSMMAVRLIELHRALKRTGSLYLHCDPVASHYLKILLDAIFGGNGFRGEIVWQRTNARATVGSWPRVHDIILYYSNTDQTIFHPTRVRANVTKMPHTLITGPDGNKFQTYELTAPGATKEGESGKPWRGFDPGRFGRHWGNNHATMDGWDADGLIHWPSKNGFPRRRDARPFRVEDRQVVVGDVWTDIDRLNQTARERLGYPTQKPLALLERIIAASSNPGDVVLDPFCGCGTAVHAAEKLNRSWIGVDITHLAIGLIERRLKDAFEGIAFEVRGVPRDIGGARDLAARDKHEFELWAVWLVDAVPQGGGKKGADRGIDGVRWVRTGPKDGDFERVIVSVKGGDNVGVGMVRDLKGTMEREGAIGGLFLTLAEPTKEMRREATASGFFDTGFGTHPKLQIVTIRELLAGMRPDLPPLGRNEGFRRAPREHGKRATQTDLGI